MRQSTAERALLVVWNYLQQEQFPRPVPPDPACDRQSRCLSPLNPQHYSCRCECRDSIDRPNFTQLAQLAQLSRDCLGAAASSGAASRPHVSQQAVQQLHPSYQHLAGLQSHDEEQQLQLLAGSVSLLHRQSLIQSLPLQLQPSFRHISTSSSTLKKHSGVVPPLHQPAKHVQGANPLKTLRAANVAAADMAGVSVAVPRDSAAAAQSAATEAVSGPWHVRLRAAASRWRARVSPAHVAMMLLTFATGVFSAILEGCQANLQSKDPFLITHSLRWVKYMLSQDTAQRVVEKGLVPQFVALIEPGADAIMLAHLFALLDQLLSYGGEVCDALLQSDLQSALARAFKEGWLPKGVAGAADGLQQKLEYQRRRRLPALSLVKS